MNRFEALRAKPSYKPVEMNQYVKTIRHLPDEEKKQLVADMVNDPRVRLYDELTTLRNPDYKKQDAKADAMFGHVCEAVTGKAEADLYGMSAKTAAGWLKVFDDDYHALFEKALIDDQFGAKELGSADAWLIQGMAAIYARFAEYSERNVCKEKKLWLKAIRLYLSFFRCASCDSSYTYQFQREDVHKRQCEQQWKDFLDTVYEKFLGRCVKSIEENDFNTLQSQMNMLSEFNLLKVSASAAQDRLVKAISEKLNYQFSLTGIGGVAEYVKTLPMKLIGQKTLLTTLLDVLRSQALARDNTAAASKTGILELWSFLTRNTNIADSNHVKLEREAFYMAMGNTMINKMFGEFQSGKCPESEISAMLAILPGDFDLTPKEGDESKKVRASGLIARFERDRLAALITPNATESTMRGIAGDAMKLVNRHLPNTKANTGPRAQIFTHLVVTAQEAEEKMRVKRDLINAFAGALPLDEKLMVNGKLTSVKDFLEGRTPPDQLIKKQIAAFKALRSGDAAARRRASADAWNFILRVSDGAGSQKEEIKAALTVGLVMAATEAKFTYNDMCAFTEAFPKTAKISDLTLPNFLKSYRERSLRSDIEALISVAVSDDDVKMVASETKEALDLLFPLKGIKNKDHPIINERTGMLTHMVVRVQERGQKLGRKELLLAFLKALPENEQIRFNNEVMRVCEFIEKITPRDFNAEIEKIAKRVEDAGQGTLAANAAGRDAQMLINELSASASNRNEKKALYTSILTAFVVALSKLNAHPYAVETFLQEFSSPKDQLNAGGDKLTVKGFTDNYRKNWLSKKAEAILEKVKQGNSSAAYDLNSLYAEAVKMGQGTLAANIATAAVVEAQKNSYMFRSFMGILNGDILLNTGKSTIQVRYLNI